jgi:acyl transferase domain-containing protein/acyl carrier protein
VLPPTINVTEPNPKLNIKNSAFYINTETRPWIRAEGEAPRRAGVSSFGFGGTNYHVVLEEYTQETGKNPYRINNAPFEVLLSAINPSLLLIRCQEVLANLQSDVAEKQYVELVEESKTKEIPLNVARVGFVAESPQEAIKFLKMTVDLLQKQPNSTAWEHPQGIFYRQSGLELGGKVVSLFSGQGSQYLEMGRELVMNFPALRNLYGYMDSLLLKDNMQPLSEIVFPHPVFEDAEKNAQIAALQRTEYAQPAIGMLSAGMYKILQQAGFKSDFVAGHSFGEITALWAAGVFNDEDYCKLVKARGQAMAPPQDPDYDAGAMLAVKEDLHKVEAVLKHFPRVMIANYNTQKQVVLAGPTAEINRVKQALQDQSYSAVLLPVSAAFHTPLIAFAQKSFAIALKSVQFQTPKLPVYSNTTGNQYANEPQTIQHVLESHLSSSVLFKQEIEHIYAAGGSCFVEFGPRKILSNLVKEILGERPHLTIALNSNSQKNSDRTLREAVVQLRVAGMNLQNLDPFQQPLTVPPVTAGNKTLTIKLNGANFVSEKTRKGWEETLKGGDKVQLMLPSDTVVSSIQEIQPSIPSDTVVSSIKEIQPVISAKELETVINSPVSTNGHHSPAANNGKQAKSSIPQPDSTVSKVICSEVSQNENLSGNSLVNPPNSELPQLTSSTNQPVRESKMQTIPNNPGDYQQILGSLEYVLTQFQQNQTENLQVHGLYLNNQKEYAQTFFQLMQQQNGLFAKNGNSDIKPVVMESLERSMMQFHSQQGETLRIHEQYLQNQIEYTQSFLKLIHQEYKQLIAGEVTVNPAVLSESKSTPVVASVPTPTQIKPVESVSAPIETKPVESVPTPTQIKPVESVPAPTQIKPVESVPAPVEIKPVESVPAPTQIKPVESVPAPTQIQPVVESVPTPVEIKPIAANIPKVTIDLSDLGDRLLAITSEKTGYPVEMLEMDMDMEADLGIDSIKRVEILGGLQEIYPNLPEPNLEDLAELRTIGQIVEYLQTNNAPAASPTSTPVPTPAPVEITISAVQKATDIPIPELEITPPIQVLTPDNTPTTVVSTTPTVSPTVSSDFANLDKSLLEITSEKTGYPVEMLELDMDMEADLGIDSIKRVEILGALQEAYPDLPKPDNMEELAELRTIGQIVTYLQDLAGGEKKKPESGLEEVGSGETRSREQGDKEQGAGGIEALQVPSLPVTEFKEIHTPVECNIKRLPARLVELGKPDFLDFTLPEGYVAIVTDDGTLTTTSVVQSLCDRGWKVVVLNFPASLVPEKSPLPQGVNRIALNDLSEEHLQQQLSAIADYCGTVAAFIHLHPHFPNNSPEILYHPDEKAIVKHVFFIAKYLKKPLVETANHTRSCFITVAHLDGSFGLQHQNNFGAIGAGLFGLTKTMLWEWVNVYCRAVDLSPELTSNEAANSIIAEIHDANRYLTEVGYGNQGRVTLIAD